MYPWDFVRPTSREAILDLIQNQRGGAPAAVPLSCQRKDGEQ